MKLNLSELRKRIESGTSRLFVEGKDRTQVRQLLDIVELTKKYLTSKRTVYSQKSTIEDYEHMNRLGIELFRMFEDVEIGDET